MDLGIRGKVALVTASSKGLGRACAAVLAGEGVELVMTARGDAALRAAAGEIAERHGVRAHAVACDVSTEEGCARAVDAAREHFGRLDILVTNTGGPERADFGSATDAMWEVGFQSTMMNIVRLVRMAAPMMRERKWGRVVNIASVTARQPIKNLTISNALPTGRASKVVKISACRCGGGTLGTKMLLSTVASMDDGSLLRTSLPA